MSDTREVISPRPAARAATHYLLALITVFGSVEVLASLQWASPQRFRLGLLAVCIGAFGRWSTREVVGGVQAVVQPFLLAVVMALAGIRVPLAIALAVVVEIAPRIVLGTAVAATVLSVLVRRRRGRRDGRNGS